MATYTRLPQGEGGSPVSIPRKPVNVTLASASSSSQPPGSIPPKPTPQHNPNQQPLRSNSQSSAFEIITIQKDKFRELVQALAASVQLLQEGVGLVGPRELLNLESELGHNRDSITYSTEELTTRFLGIKQTSPQTMRHNDEILDSIFEKGKLFKFLL
jgi:hypothetical protein